MHKGRGRMRRFPLIWTTVCCVLMLWSSTAQPSRSGSESPMVAIEFDEVDIKVFVKFISTLTGKNFVLDNAVRGTVNVISPTKVTPEEAYRVFESVLEVYGFTTVPAGAVIKVVPLRDAKDKGLETVIPRREPAEGGQDSMVTQLVPLKHANAPEVQAILAPLISKASVLTAHAESNTLIITDVQSNIRRLVQIINEIDAPGAESRISVIELEHAHAVELANKLSRLLEEEQQQARPVKRIGLKKEFKLIPIEWINALVVLANEDDTRQVKKLVAVLDRPTPAGKDNIHVYYLKHAVAEDLAKVMNELRGAEKQDAAVKTTAPILSSSVAITPDSATNSLILRCSPQEFTELTKILEKLDIPRSMVYVEGLIMEVTTDKALRLGVEWHAGNDFDNQEAFWFGGATAGSGGTLGTVFSGLQGETPTFALPGGLAMGVIGRALSYGGITFPSYSALINAVRTDEDFNILSTPQILTTDNVEAEVRVAQNIPFQTRVDQGTEITSRAISTFEYRDVGVILKVTPQINQNRLVRLKIEQEVRNVIRDSTRDSAGNLILAPVTNVRSAKTTVIVRDGETVVLGGLIQDLERGDESRVPCLGNIPVLGWAFKAKSRQSEKTNLLVFLTPHIVKEPEEVRALSQRKDDEIRDAISKQEGIVGRGLDPFAAGKPEPKKEEPESTDSSN